MECSRFRGGDVYFKGKELNSFEYCRNLTKKPLVEYRARKTHDLCQVLQRDATILGFKDKGFLNQFMYQV